MKRSMVAAVVACAAGLSGPAWALRDMQGPDAAFISAERCKARWHYGDENWLQACVAMGIADYCGVGLPNTLWGTPVVIFDVDHTVAGDPRQPEVGGHEQWVEYNPASPRLFFEAGWLPFNSKGKSGGSPLCLSKKRWSTMPINGPCPDLLPDPRVTKKGHFCEDLVGGDLSADALEANDPGALASLRSQGALIFNKSSFLDAGLHLWSDGTRVLSTSHGLDLGTTQPSEPPAFAPTYAPVRTASDSLIGVLLSDNLHWLVGHLDTVESDEPHSAIVGLAGLRLRQLITYQLDTGAFVTTRHPGVLGPFGVVDKFSEGWLFETHADAVHAIGIMGAQFAGSPAQLGKLVRWERCRTGGSAGRCARADLQFATAVHPPPTFAGPAWTAVAVEGWVLRAPAAP